MEKEKREKLEAIRDYLEAQVEMLNELLEAGE